MDLNVNKTIFLKNSKTETFNWVTATSFTFYFPIHCVPDTLAIQRCMIS